MKSNIKLLEIFDHNELWKGADKELKNDTRTVLDAYENVLYEKYGRRYRATRVRMMIRDHGAIEAISRSVARRFRTKEEREEDLKSGFKALWAAGKLDLSFEAAVVRHAKFFSTETVKSAKARLAIANKIKPRR